MFIRFFVLPLKTSKMFSSPLLTSPTPPKLCHHSPFLRLPISKDQVLIRVSESKSNFCGRSGRMRVSDQMNMTESVGVDAFKGGGGCQKEGEDVSSNGSLFDPNWEFREFETTLNGMSKWLVAALLGLLIISKHDAEAMWVATGSVANSWISNTLKQVLNHERPASALRSDPGMPSSHAQSIFYIAPFAVLSLFRWQGINAFTIFVGTSIFIIGSYLSWLRVSQQLHTVSQVNVGAILGSACSIIWSLMWQSFVMRAFDSSLWVRLILVLGCVIFFVALFLSLVHHWLRDEATTYLNSSIP